MAFSRNAPITLYRHIKSAEIYIYIGEAEMEASHEIMVVYKSLLHGKAWIRPKEEFMERFQFAGNI